MRTLVISILFAAFGLSLGCGASAPRSAPSYSPPPVQAGAVQRGRADAAVRVQAAESAGPSFFKNKKSQPDKRPSSSGASARTSVDQKLVKNAWLTIRVRDEDDFGPAVDQCELVARRLDGYVTRKTSSSIAFKIPTGRLDEALAAVTELGKVKSREVTTVDVTANYVDLRIRIDNLKKVRARLQELVEQGQNVKEILEVEKELARITTQLEALQGQMRLLENQTSYATVSVSFEERVLPGPIGWVFYGAYKAVKWLFVWD